MFNNYFIFMFIWELFECLFLVYKNKFLKENKIFYCVIGRNIIKFIRLNVIKYVFEIGSGVIFLEFMNYVVKI